MMFRVVPSHFGKLDRARHSPAAIDTILIVPIVACAYVSIVSPLIYYFASGYTKSAGMEADLLNRVFWPVMGIIAVVLAVRNRTRLTLPLHIICLFACLAFAGASVLWAFKPEISFARFVQQVMVVTSIVLPILVTSQRADAIRALFLCFAFGSIVNILVLGATGDTGYLAGKNALGAFGAIALLLALHEILYPGRRRALGIIAAVIAISLLLLSNSKTSFALALVAPFLAGLVLIARKTARISPAIVVLFVLIAYVALARMGIFDIYRLSYWMYGDATLSARTLIWDFVQWEISQRPYMGWGYQSFWLVGSDGLSVVQARGWITLMPHAHNGYLDLILQMGYVGLSLFVVFIFAVFHAIGRVSDRAPSLAWLMLSITIFVAVHNFLESSWMRGSDLLWVVFLVVVADLGRRRQPAAVPLTGTQIVPKLDKGQRAKALRATPNLLLK